MRDYHHPNIISMIDSHLVDQELWVIMEYLEGGSLTDIVTTMHLSEEQMATVCKQVIQTFKGGLKCPNLKSLWLIIIFHGEKCIIGNL